ncbi:hypothetical protein SK128_005255 [Halocaridina rubra]|uniref:Alkaline phosphatase n=1 Tax=Halocaridina rubra TaxID=373956 RepID=A0AAN8WJD7_HALRR
MAVHNYFVASFILICLPGTQLQKIFPVPRVEDQAYWHAQATADIEHAIKVATTQNWGIAKNIVMFVGDGLGITPTVAGRIYKGQRRFGHSGEEGYLSWEKFPHLALIKNYNLDETIPDSGATATALFCGAKGNFYTLGLDHGVKRDQCMESLNQKNWQSSIMSWAQDANKDTGFVTTTTVTHATPAALYAHSPSRYWECDASLGEIGHGCRDIAKQLVEDAPGKNAKVIMGGGRLPLGASKFPTIPRICKRNDGRNLTHEWVVSKSVHGHTVKYVQTAEELLSADVSKTDYLMGLFDKGHMNFEAERDKSPRGQPSLANMTSVAIKILSKNKRDGFFLMVEGGRIDHALHLTESKRALEDIIAFDEAIQTGLSMLDLSETLVIVTADHSHVMTINGYSKRGNDILGISDVKSAIDDMPYPTLMYTNGPRYAHYWDGKKVRRPDVRKEGTSSLGYQPTVAVPDIYETHSGDDVAAYATGPMSHLLHSLHEQSYIAHVMGLAACIGPYRDNCTRPEIQLFRLHNRHTNLL